MKVLWVKSDFLHPTTRGGQIRTLEMLRRLHRRHEIHYVAFSNPAYPEAVARSAEYASKAYPVEHRVPGRGSLVFAAQILKSAWSPWPLSLDRYRSTAMRGLIASLVRHERFDAIVCDFLTPAPNLPCLSDCVLFQHNIETMIWRRHASTAAGSLRRLYFGLQARRMFAYERHACRAVRHVIAVSEADAQGMRELFGVQRVSHVPTGVDIAYFSPPDAPVQPSADLVFLGSMDWMPNIDGVVYFVREVLPLIRRSRPECSLAIVGKDPLPEILRLARDHSGISVTGTVPDVRPYLWGSRVSIVPLRIGGGTRLKIYESMAARVPVVSTVVGAEGLDVQSPRDIRLADDPRSFAAACVALLEDAAARKAQAENAWRLVADRFSWERVAQNFEAILQRAAADHSQPVQKLC
jgi:glycosyltransferase involved in cell wall biosynthesis